MAIKILYLYTEMMGYNISVLECLVKNHQASVEVVHWTRNKLTPYTPSVSQGITLRDRSAFSTETLNDFAERLKPDLVYVSGWQDKAYLRACARLKSQGAKVVVGLDSQWTGSLRQQLGAQLIRRSYKRRFYDYAWVPGPLQFEYAKRIGFKNKEIITNLLSGNSHLFAQAQQALIIEKIRQYPKQFLYVGRYADAKGVDILADAYQIYREKYGGNWSLTCIGNGPLFNVLSQKKGITVADFASQTVLMQQACASGVFILPSRYEPWGVVVHEFATAGLPLLLSEHVGSRHQFLIDGLNGFTFYNNSAEDLADSMHRISTLSDGDLRAMGTVSALLAGVQTPEVAAASFMSVYRDSSIKWLT